MNFKVHVILNTINNAKKVPFRRFRDFKKSPFYLSKRPHLHNPPWWKWAGICAFLVSRFQASSTGKYLTTHFNDFFQLLIHVEFQVCQSFALHRLPIRKSFTSRPCFFAVTANRKAFHAFSYSFVSRIILNFIFRNLFFCKTQIL